MKLKVFVYFFYDLTIKNISLNLFNYESKQSKQSGETLFIFTSDSLRVTGMIVYYADPPLINCEI